MPYKHLDKQVVYDLYFNKNITKKEICKILNCSDRPLNRLFKDCGWKARHSGKMVGQYMKNKSKILPYFDEIKKAYIEDKNTCLSIAQRFNVSETAIARLLQKNGVILRQLSEAQVKKFVIDKEELLDMYVNKKLSCIEIAKQKNTTEEIIRINLIKFDIDRRSKTESLQKFSLEDLDEMLKNGNMIRVTKLNSLNDLTNRREKILVKCLKDGLEWKAQVSNLLQGIGCPFCKYKGEKYTYQILLEILTNITIEAHYKIGTYIGQDNKSHNIFVDYYLKLGGKEIVIEYNGEQHYKLVKWSKNEETNIKKFQHQQFRDNKLREHCKANNIYLIEIDERTIEGKGTDKKENIKQCLLKKLQEHIITLEKTI